MSSLAALLFSLSAPLSLAHAPVAEVHIVAVPEVGGMVRTQVTVTSPDDTCQVLANDATATLNGAPMQLHSVGRPMGPVRISGIEVPQEGCSPGYFTGEHRPHEAGPAQLIIQSGAQRIELLVPHLLAARKLSAPPTVHANAQIILRVTPDDASDFLCPKGTEVSVYQGNKRFAAVTDLRFEGRKITFQLPALEPGKAQLVLQCSGGPLPVARCLGAKTCRATVAAAPDGVQVEVVASP